MDDAANIESHIAKASIHAEATVERENEATSLEQIKLLGKARVEEIIDSIENIFWHMAGCLKHITTEEGRQQFLFYIGSVAVLVFVVSTSKELITLGCLVAFRFFTAAKLVREYGNQSLQVFWADKQTQTLDEMVLPPETKERMDGIVKVADAASKRQFPLRSVLVCGKPGSGKSMLAKSIAQSIPSLPYALINGSDVFPLGSQGPAELRRLLTWASNKRQGGIILIDEAESILGSRAKSRPDNKDPGNALGSENTATSSSYSRDCLNVLLSMTGTFGNIMLILTTCNPGELDEAVLDRMDEILEIELPGEDERREMLSRHIDTYLLKPKLATLVDIGEDEIERLVKETDGFSGRSLSKLAISFQAQAYLNDANLTAERMFLIVENHKNSITGKARSVCPKECIDESISYKEVNNL